MPRAFAAWDWCSIEGGRPRSVGESFHRTRPIGDGAASADGTPAQDFGTTTAMTRRDPTGDASPADPPSGPAAPLPAAPPAGVFRNAPIEQALGLYLPATVAFRLINFGRIILLSWFMLKQQFGLLNM